MSTDKTLEDILYEVYGLNETQSNAVASFIRSREAKRGGWVKAWERLPDLGKTVYLRSREYKSVGNFFTWPGAKPGETQLASTWYPIVSKDYERQEIEWYDESLPEREPDAEKDKRIAELENQIKEMSEGHAAEMKSMYESGDKALYRIQQLESQLKGLQLMRESDKPYIELLKDANSNLESQLQASKVDAEKLFDDVKKWQDKEYEDEEEDDTFLSIPDNCLLITKDDFIKAIQSIQ